MSTYEPGTIAAATFKGQMNVRVVRVRDYWESAVTGDRIFHDRFDLIADIRPLVVLDLEDSDQIDSLCKSLVEAMHAAGDRASAANGVHPATVRTALARLTKPSRIDEPGAWAVVKATVDGYGREATFVSHPDMEWSHATPWLSSFGKWFAWADLVDPTLIREGLTS